MKCTYFHILRYSSTIFTCCMIFHHVIILWHTYPLPVNGNLWFISIISLCSKIATRMAFLHINYTSHYLSTLPFIKNVSHTLCLPCKFFQDLAFAHSYFLPITSQAPHLLAMTHYCRFLKAPCSCLALTFEFYAFYFWESPPPFSFLPSILPPFLPSFLLFPSRLEASSILSEQKYILPLLCSHKTLCITPLKCFLGELSFLYTPGKKDYILVISVSPALVHWNRVRI